MKVVILALFLISNFLINAQTAEKSIQLNYKSDVQLIDNLNNKTFEFVVPTDLGEDELIKSAANYKDYFALEILKNKTAIVKLNKSEDKIFIARLLMSLNISHVILKNDKLNINQFTLQYLKP